MLDIKVTEDYKLTSDGMQIIVQKRKIIDPSLAPKHIQTQSQVQTETREEWKNWKFCGKIEQALDLIAKQHILESEAKTLNELAKEIRDFQNTLKSLLK